jgi:RNA polymerase sigma factor (TIGR02999 family)
VPSKQNRANQRRWRSYNKRAIFAKVLAIFGVRINNNQDITLLLEQIRLGNENATDELVRLIYPELRALAAAQMRHERSDHTLQPTALVNEAYLRIFGQDQEWENRAHFFAAASTAIRRILVEHARARRRLKRGGANQRETLTSVMFADTNKTVDLMVLDEALGKLAQLHERHAKVVEMKFFGGMTMSAIAEALDVSLRTIESDWRVARLWLVRELGAAEE